MPALRLKVILVQNSKIYNDARYHYYYCSSTVVLIVVLTGYSSIVFVQACIAPYEYCSVAIQSGITHTCPAGACSRQVCWKSGLERPRFTNHSRHTQQMFAHADAEYPFTPVYSSVQHSSQTTHVQCTGPGATRVPFSVIKVLIRIHRFFFPVLRGSRKVTFGPRGTNPRRQ